LKLSHRAVVACLALLIGLALLVAGTARPVRSAPARAVTGGCPQNVTAAISFGPRRWVAISRALQAQVPRVYANLTSMGHIAWPGFQIRALVLLSGGPLGADFGPAIRGFKNYVTLAARACGLRAADNSVLVFLQFPNCQLPCSNSWAYLTFTRKGWHLWTSYQV
jgi:hypothetical protein